MTFAFGSSATMY